MHRKSLQHESDPDVMRYRQEAVASKERNAKGNAARLADVQAIFDAQLAKEAESRKGGRPGTKRWPMRIGKADPADALLDALGTP